MAISTLNTTDTFNTWRTLFNNLVNEHNSGSTTIVDGDEDTKIQVEESSDEDIIRFDTGGTERMTIAADGAIAIAGAITGSSTIQGTTITATTAFVPDASDGAALGTSSLEFSDLFLADGAVISFGADQDQCFLRWFQRRFANAQTCTGVLFGGSGALEHAQV